MENPFEEIPRNLAANEDLEIILTLFSSFSLNLLFCFSSFLFIPSSLLLNPLTGNLLIKYEPFYLTLFLFPPEPNSTYLHKTTYLVSKWIIHCIDLDLLFPLCCKYLTIQISKIHLIFFLSSRILLFNILFWLICFEK